MITLKNLLDRSIAILKKVSSTPRLDAEIIMQYAFNLSKTDIILKPYLIIDESEAKYYFDLIEKRRNHCPVSHIIGIREFWGFDFIVNKYVLDPRCDSEILISTALKLYKNLYKKLNFLDLGTGSGCLMISLLKLYRNSLGIAFEKNIHSYRVAVLNRKKHNLQSRMKISCKSWLNARGLFDLIVSNPPYIRRKHIEFLQPDVRLHEPIMALDGGAVGIECYIQIFKIIRSTLKMGGYALLEIGESQEHINKHLLYYDLKFCGYINDLRGKKRCIIIKKISYRSNKSFSYN